MRVAGKLTVDSFCHMYVLVCGLCHKNYYDDDDDYYYYYCYYYYYYYCCYYYYYYFYCLFM